MIYFLSLLNTKNVQAIGYICQQHLEQRVRRGGRPANEAQETTEAGRRACQNMHPGKIVIIFVRCAET